MSIYHVAKNGSDKNAGTESAPFLTINAAAHIARAGDTVVVHEGEYREWVVPRAGGLSNTRRITYTAAEGEHVTIKGSERIQGWEKVQGSTWKVSIPNSFFGCFNPYSETVGGDWYLTPWENPVHLGDVYLNGMSFFEAENLEGVHNPVVNETVTEHRIGQSVPVADKEQQKYRWFASVDDDKTEIYANFQGADPNRELVEINVRKCCFYPVRPGINYITVKGFELAQAACPWTPPTADQPGLIGAHWSRGWIIEDNIIHDAKCSAVSIGKEISTGDNDRTNRKDKPGYQYQLEAVFKAAKIGWSKEKIGSHIIRNNTIYDCGQNGIVGHLGCVFSQIYGNHIYNIATKREFFGHEIAGIKLHAAIDVIIRSNHIHGCTLGIWLDWQAQGARISRNLLYDNNCDLFLEVSHGPSIIDYNIFGSEINLFNDAQGMAYVHNLFAGRFVQFYSKDRSTQYHTPHSTDVAGFSATFGGDDRYFSNIFTGGAPDVVFDKTDPNPNLRFKGYGTAGFNGHPTSLEEYIGLVDAKQPCDHNVFMDTKQPVYISGNVYMGASEVFDKESLKLLYQGFDAAFSIEKEKADDTVCLKITLPEGFNALTSDAHTTRSLGRTRISDADFENPDGSPVVLDTDFFGNPAEGKSVAGPISSLKAGENVITIQDCLVNDIIEQS